MTVNFPRTWRRPKDQVHAITIDDGWAMASITTPLISRRVWYRPWTWKVTVYPHRSHVHLAFFKDSR